VFQDGTDIYWARSRVLEYLNFARNRLPASVTPSLGPAATGVGWSDQKLSERLGAVSAFQPGLGDAIASAGEERGNGEGALSGGGGPELRTEFSGDRPGAVDVPRTGKADTVKTEAAAVAGSGVGAHPVIGYGGIAMVGFVCSTEPSGKFWRKASTTFSVASTSFVTNE